MTQTLDKNNVFPIGTKYTLRRGKRVDECEVIDHLFTYNSKGELVKIRHVSKHTMCGQDIIDYDVNRTTIQLALFRMNNENKEG